MLRPNFSRKVWTVSWYRVKAWVTERPNAIPVNRGKTVGGVMLSSQAWILRYNECDLSDANSQCDLLCAPSAYLPVCFDSLGWPWKTNTCLKPATPSTYPLSLSLFWVCTYRTTYSGVLTLCTKCCANPTVTPCLSSDWIVILSASGT
jgi:hypothetical protein